MSTTTTFHQQPQTKPLGPSIFEGSKTSMPSLETPGSKDNFPTATHAMQSPESRGRHSMPKAREHWREWCSMVRQLELTPKLQPQLWKLDARAPLRPPSHDTGTVTSLKPWVTKTTAKRFEPSPRSNIAGHQQSREQPQP